ncbi:MAG: glycosyltransferase family 2 protein [Actinomycetota bacterium]
MDLSIIIVNYNGQGYIQKCTDSLKKLGSGLSWEVLVVDNGSTDGSLDYLRALGSSRGFKIIEMGENTGFACASNMGAEQARGKFLLFLNPDVRLLDTNMYKLINFYYQKSRDCKVGAIGVKLVNLDGTLQHNARSFPTLARQFFESCFLYRIKHIPFFSSYFLSWWDHGSVREVDWLSGAFLFLQKDAFFDAGRFDERYFIYSEDADLCLALARKGYRNYYYPFFSAEHADGGIACRDMGTRLAQIWASRTAYFKKNYSNAHAVAASLLYFLGIINRLCVFTLTAKRKKAKDCWRALGHYFKKRYA